MNALAATLLLVALGAPQDAPQGTEEVLAIEPVWSGHPVGFCLLTQVPWQFAGYYDAERRLSIARRRLGEREWQITRLPERVGWDSHNSIRMVFDSTDHLHLAGNMHAEPLKYYRSRAPLDPSTFERIPAMVGALEKRVTYPHFLRDKAGALIFTYRSGASGNGEQIYNVYDPGTRRWRRLLDEPLTSGLGRMNAYHEGPLRGPDGRFHLAWIWRDTPDCETCHDICYARSPDLVHWETSAGEPLKLPITLASAEIVDPVPARGGAINGNVKLGFDSEQRVVLSYHKYDRKGRTQVYHARRESAGWKHYCSTEWEERWMFSGRGTIAFEVRLGPVRPAGDGRLHQWTRHANHGSGTRILAERDFSFLGLAELPPPWPAALSKPQSKHPGMQVRWCSDSGTSGEPGVRYALRWETLGVNRDRAHEDPPPPAMLHLVRL